MTKQHEWKDYYVVNMITFDEIYLLNIIKYGFIQWAQREGNTDGSECVFINLFGQTS